MKPISKRRIRLRREETAVRKALCLVFLGWVVHLSEYEDGSIVYLVRFIGGRNLVFTTDGTFVVCGPPTIGYPADITALVRKTLERKLAELETLLAVRRRGQKVVKTLPRLRSRASSEEATESWEDPSIAGGPVTGYPTSWKGYRGRW